MSFGVIPIPAPTQGWNTVDPEDEMGPRYALRMDNIRTNGQRVFSRNGSTSHATGLGTGVVERLFVHKDPDGTKTLIACANNRIYDASSAGVATDLTGALTITSNEWHAHNINGKLVLLNGVNTPLQIDKTSVSTAVFTGSGLTATNLVQGTVFRNRQYLIEKNTLNIWYAASDAITGALSKLDISSAALNGGSLQAVGSYTRGSGQTSQNLFVAATTEGEILIYQGDYPDNAFELVARYFVGRTLGRRCFVNYGSDIAVISENGVFPLSRLLASSNAEADLAAVDLTQKINNKFAEQAAASLSSVRWSGEFWGNSIIFNVPDVDGTTYHQYEFNNIAQAWCRWIGQNAACWAVYNSELYYGGLAGEVFKADNSYNDDDVPMEITLHQPYSALGDISVKKRVVDIRPTISTQRDVTLNIYVDFDLEEQQAENDIALGLGASYTPWGSVWGSDWSAGQVINKAWFPVSGDGYLGSVRLEGTLDGGGVEIKSSLLKVEYLAGI